MKNSSKHSINKVFLEINTNSKEEGYYLKDNIDTFLKEEIFSVIETHFDLVTQKKPFHSIQIERLELEITVNPDLDFVDFKQKVITNITKQIQQVFGEKMENVANTSSLKLLSEKAKRIEEFLYFLETGTNPWWTVSGSIVKTNTAEKFQEMINDADFAVRFFSILEKSIARSRFIKQFDDEQLVMIITKVASHSNVITNQDQIIKIKKTIEEPLLHSKPTETQRNLIWEIVLLNVVSKDITVTKQKVFQLLYSLFEFDKNVDKNIITTEINDHIETKVILELLTNLRNEILFIEKSIKEKTATVRNILIAKMNQSTEDQNKIFGNKPTLGSSKKNLDGTEKSSNNNFNLSIKNKENILEDSKEKEEKLQCSTEFIDQKNKHITDYFVENAGLLIIHPFLKHLFNNCKLLNNDNTINSPEVAAHLLHYIATGREQDYENRMIFEKFLCNIPLDKPIERNIILSEKMKYEAQEMLQATINNWKALKKSSIKLLQNEFLQRQGKIILIENENPKIIIERKTQDILLNRLDWNLSIIKLAWKKNIIYVDW